MADTAGIPFAVSAARATCQRANSVDNSLTGGSIGDGGAWRCRSEPRLSSLRSTTGRDPWVANPTNGTDLLSIATIDGRSPIRRYAGCVVSWLEGRGRE